MTDDGEHWPWPTEEEAFATFKRLIEEHTGKSLDDPTLTREEVHGAVAVIQAEAAVWNAAERGEP
jgi:hypothetical protein